MSTMIGSYGFYPSKNKCQERVHDLSQHIEIIEMRNRYASDVSQEKFEEIRPLLLQRAPTHQAHDGGPV